MRRAFRSDYLGALGGGAAEHAQGGSALRNKGRGSGAGEEVNVKVAGGNCHIGVVHAGDLFKLDLHALLVKVAHGIGDEYADRLHGLAEQADLESNGLFGRFRRSSFRLGRGGCICGLAVSGRSLRAAASGQNQRGKHADKNDDTYKLFHLDSPFFFYIHRNISIYSI